MKIAYLNHLETISEAPKIVGGSLVAGSRSGWKNSQSRKPLFLKVPLPMGKAQQ